MSHGGRSRVTAAAAACACVLALDIRTTPAPGARGPSTCSRDTREESELRAEEGGCRSDPSRRPRRPPAKARGECAAAAARQAGQAVSRTLARA